ncbi:MAG: magnesium transporter CorA family protein [Elusimicrobiota bacterium]|jgi:magnesium transporter|nr:magnesium transporter CorA family protein [Elusimicrobiota bacterium]
MIKAIYLKNSQVFTDFDATNIAKIYEEGVDIIWVDIHLDRHELTTVETSLLAETFKFHYMSIEDCLFPQYYPKMEEFENYLFGAIHGIQLKPNYYQEFDDSIYELNLFIGDGFVVTVHIEELFFIETLFEKCKASPPLIELKNIEKLLYSIFNKVVSSYEFTLEKIDNKIEDLEDEIIKNPESSAIEEILDTKKIIFAMRKIAEPQQSAYLYFTRAGKHPVPEEALVYFRDICTQSAMINQAILLRSQMAMTLLEIYMSSITVKLTEITKFLTIIATLLLPVLIISGYYGMNIKFPEYSIFGESGAWFFALSLMVVSIVAMVIYFIKKKWF